MAQSIADIAAMLKNAQNILILAHTQPDGDTLGSCYALSHALSSVGCNTKICCDSAAPEKYDVLFDKSLILSPAEAEGRYDLVIALDCADKSRLGKTYKLFKEHSNTINIDHHISNEGFAKLNYIEDASSVGEIVYKLLCEMNIAIDEFTAKYLYIAISTDTGNFTYSNTSRSCLKITSELVEKFELAGTAEILFRSRTLVSTQLIGRSISHLQTYADGKIASMFLTLSDLEEFGADGSDCDNIVNYAREIDTVAAAVFFRELHTGVKVSLRSKGDVDVCEIAAFFGGGGHKNAAGCFVGEKMDEARKQVIDRLLKLV